jgi:hypothetical protein
VTSNETIVELVKRHVLHEDEQVERVRNWPDGIALATDLRHFVAASESDSWALSHESWVDDVVVATRDDLIIEGQPERFGFALLADGGDVYLNDKTAVGELGRRLDDGMQPLGYAEILVAFHPYSSATRAPLAEADGLRRVFGQPSLPDVAPMRLDRAPDGLTLMFSSYVRYRWPGSAPQLDMLEWAVRVPVEGPASWESREIATGLALTDAG